MAVNSVPEKWHSTSEIFITLSAGGLNPFWGVGGE